MLIQNKASIFYTRYSRCLAQRLAAALLAISRRRSAVSFSARALPPLSPPRRPSDTAAGSLPSCAGAGLASDACPVATSVISFASWFASRGRFGFLERSTMPLIWHGRLDDASPGRARNIFKLTHFLPPRRRHASDPIRAAALPTRPLLGKSRHAQGSGDTIARDSKREGLVSPELERTGTPNLGAASLGACQVT